MSTSTAEVGYPVHVDAELDPLVSRGLWLVKWLLAIPHYVVLAFLWLAFFVTSILVFFAILFTGRYPRALFDFNVGVMRWSWRVAYYAYGVLGTDRYPPFTLADVPDYPAHLDVDYPEHLSRGLVLVKWWLLAIPHYLVLGLFLGGLGYGVRDADDRWMLEISLLGLLVLVAGVVLLVTGRYPKPVFDLVLGLNRWVLRVTAYVALMTDRYPPFALVQGGHEPGHGSSHQPPADESIAPVQGPTHVQQPAKGWSAGRVVSLVLGALMVVGGLGAAGAGITLAVLDQQARDADGFLTSPSETLSSDGFAVVSEDARIHTGGTLGRLPDRLVGDVKLSAERTGGAEVFLGIAPSADVTTYLAGVRHDTLLEVPAGGPVYRSADGGAPATPPTEQTFWVAQATGVDPELTWELEDGDWTAVMMNADGTAPVVARVSVGAELPALGAAITVLLVLAAGSLLVGAVLIAAPVAAVRAEQRHGAA